MSLSPERRQALLGVKLAALVRERWGNVDGSTGTFPGGAALISPKGPTGGTEGAGPTGSTEGAGPTGDTEGAGPTGDTKTAWVLAADPSTRTLGGALAWTLRRGATELHLLVETDSGVAGVLARRAAEFALPITVWQIWGRDLLAVEPAPISAPPPLPAGVARFADVLRAHGAEPVVEHGVLTGEVLGLEVARVLVDEAGARLEVGVGSQDRRAQLLLRPDRQVTEALAAAVDAVRGWRAPGATPHPAATLAGERWLRAAVVSRPDLVGAAHLAPVPPPLPRGDLRQPSPAPAAGVDTEDRPVLVVCSTGIDLDLVPSAADARLADGRAGVRLVLAVPPGDDHPVTRDLAAALHQPAEVVTVPADWQTLAPVP